MAKRDGYTLVAQSDWHAELGNRFRRLREANGVALKPLAKRIGRTYFTIRRHEAGEMMLRADDLIRAADIIGVPPGDLLNVPPCDMIGEK